jgi:DNA methylase
MKNKDGLLEVLNPADPDSLVLSSKFTPDGVELDVIEGEFWTSAQRQGINLHEISYRACFKPQLPAFFIERLSSAGDLIYDPFSGRGTTAIESAIHSRRVAVNDVNPLTRYLTLPRLEVPIISDVEERLKAIPRDGFLVSDIDLSMFYEDQTLQEILNLRSYLAQRESDNLSDSVDRWIRMVATNRLTGHSPGFFSVYSMPPNQAVSQESQVRINKKRNQLPTYRDTKALILKKSRQLQKGLTDIQVSDLRTAAKSAIFLCEDASQTAFLGDGTVQLTVTSPPFLDVVQYSDDNWLRGWFNSIDMESVARKITMSKTLEDWNVKMSLVIHELFRITKPGGYLAFEVGEIRNGTIKLEDAVIPIGIEAGFRCLGVILNTQEFTKTSNIWGVNNNSRGTNTNRIVLFSK